MSTDPKIGTLASPEILTATHSRRREFLDAIQLANLDHVFIADHVSFHVGAGMDGLINAATLLASHPETHVLLGVYLLALRHPVTVARQLASLSESAPGRLTFGVGIGGEDRNEIAMCGVDPASRGRRTNEALEIVQSLLTGEPMDYQGEFFQFKKAWIRPKVEPAIPFMIGGRSDAALNRTVRYADGWLASWCSLERFTQAVDLMRKLAVERPQFPAQHGLQLWAGFDNDKIKARTRLAKGMEQLYRVPFEKFERYAPYGSVEEVADFLRGYRDAGCRIFNIMPVAERAEAGIEAVAEVKRLLALPSR